MRSLVLSIIASAVWAYIAVSIYYGLKLGRISFFRGHVIDRASSPVTYWISLAAGLIVMLATAVSYGALSHP